MSPEWASLITGPSAAVVVLTVAVVILAKAQIVVPGKMYSAAEERNKLLENEALEQQKILKAQSEQLSEHKATNARLEERVLHLTQRIELLGAEIQQLRARLEQ